MQDSNPEQPMKSTLKNERNLRYIYSWTNAILIHCYTRATWTMHQRPNSLHQLHTLLIFRQVYQMNNLGCSVATKAYIQMKHMVLAQYGMYVSMSEYKSIFESCTFITKKDGSHWHLKYIQIQKHYVHKNCGQVKKSTTTAAKRKQFTRALWTRPLPLLLFIKLVFHFWRVKQLLGHHLANYFQQSSNSYNNDVGKNKACQKKKKVSATTTAEHKKLTMMNILTVDKKDNEPAVMPVMVDPKPSAAAMKGWQITDMITGAQEQLKEKTIRGRIK